MAEGITITGGKVAATKTTAPDTTGDASVEGTFSGALPQDKVTVGVRGYMINSGTADSDDGAHALAVLGLAEDTTSGAQEIYGVEGRVNGRSTTEAIAYRGVLGLGNFQGSTFSGRMYGVVARSEIFEADGTTPLSEGLGIGVYIPSIIGGAGKYSVYGKDAMRVDSNLWIFDPTATNYGLLYKGTGGDLVIESDNAKINFSDNDIITSGDARVGELKIKLYAQGTEPTIVTDGAMVVWVDTSDSCRTYLIIKRGTGDQLKVEFT